MSSKPAGYLYWRSHFGGLAPEAQRYPVDSGTPAGSYLRKYELTEAQMQMSLAELMKQCPLEDAS